MAESKKESRFWGIFGKASLVIVLIWTIIQIYNTVFKSSYSVQAIGDHHSVSYPPTIHDDKLLLNKYIFFLRHFPIKEVKIKSTKELDSIVKKFAEIEKERFNIDFDDLNELYQSITIWSISIKNIGNSPLEELNAELPISGHYQLIDPDNKVISGNFSNRLKLGNLNPSFSYKLTIWAKGFGSEYNDVSIENDCKVNHKYGTLSISFPYRADGFMAKLLRIDPLFFILGILIILLIILYSIPNKARTPESQTEVKPEAEEKK